MITFRPHSNGVLSLCLWALTPFVFAAQNPVSVESLSANQGQEAEIVPFQPPIEDELDQAQPSGGELHYQMQLLQQEVQQLRGLVEQLTYELGQVRKTQSDRYLELDGRFQRLTEQMSSGPISPMDRELADDAVVDGAITASQDEKTLYDTAVELIRSRQYDLAITQLQSGYCAIS